MKYSVIVDIFFNDRRLGADIPVSEEFKRVLKRLEAVEGRVKAGLPEDGREKIMEDYTYLQGELNCEAEKSAFAEGFKTGLLLGAEVFSDLNKTIENLLGVW